MSKLNFRRCFLFLAFSCVLLFRFMCVAVLEFECGVKENDFCIWRLSVSHTWSSRLNNISYNIGGTRVKVSLSLKWPLHCFCHTHKLCVVADQACNIAKGITDPGIDCFKQINNLKDLATSPQDAKTLLHHTNSVHIAVKVDRNMCLI